MVGGATWRPSHDGRGKGRGGGTENGSAENAFGKLWGELSQAASPLRDFSEP